MEIHETFERVEIENIIRNHVNSLEKLLAMSVRGMIDSSVLINEFQKEFNKSNDKIVNTNNQLKPSKQQIDIYYLKLTLSAVCRICLENSDDFNNEYKLLEDFLEHTKNH